ncbi:uncharacterized protein [Parasteatoda tepidariorum]|uniref:uncharacterized protein n=1 Tax=Parasteatoda tepidariorum TaxID=114398 RepID=UPI00077FD0F9|nr:uncharacterized protein LOC107441930 isoform X1 [Parasteatoda tepidariorum]
MKNLSSQSLTIFHITQFLFFFCLSINTQAANGQCLNGFELACEWLHDDKSALKWVFKTDEDGSNVVELKECEYPNCGVGVITTTWLKPREQEEWMSFNYKIYGTSEVYLRIYLRTADGGGGQHQIFSQTGNYAHEFPKSWTEREVLLPAVSSKHRILIKAHIPFKEAYVAVKDIVLKGNTLATSTPVAAGIEREDELATKSESTEILPNLVTVAINATDDTFINVSSDDSSSSVDYEDENGLGDSPPKSIEEERFQALEVDFIGSEDLTKGYTRVVEPNLCKYS